MYFNVMLSLDEIISAYKNDTFGNAFCIILGGKIYD